MRWVIVNCWWCQRTFNVYVEDGGVIFRVTYFGNQHTHELLPATYQEAS